MVIVAMGKDVMSPEPVAIKDHNSDGPFSDITPRLFVVVADKLGSGSACLVALLFSNCLLQVVHLTSRL
jgi:hypothetical protein